MTSTPSTKNGIILMLVSVVLFAVNALLIKAMSVAYPAADGWVASLFRGVVGLVVVASLFHGRGLQFIHLFTRPLLIIRGLIGGFGILAFYITVVHLGAGRAVIINLTYPMFGSLFAAIWLKERMAPGSMFWMLAGFTGLMIFIGLDLQAGMNSYDVLALVGAVAAGAVVVLIRQLRHSEHTATIYASQCFASAGFAAWPAFAPAASLPSNAILLMVVAAVIVAIAQLAMTHAYRSLSVARGSSIQMILPVATACGGFLLFGETFTGVEMLGAALTLLATWQIVRAPAPGSTPAAA